MKASVETVGLDLGVAEADAPLNAGSRPGMRLPGGAALDGLAGDRAGSGAADDWATPRKPRPFELSSSR